MTKSELSALLHRVGIPVGEGEQFLDSAERMPKIAYWEYIWEDVMASGDDYDMIVMYQISFVSSRPRDPALIRLRELLNEAGIHPVIYHEYIKGDASPGHFHSYFNIEVQEEI